MNQVQRYFVAACTIACLMGAAPKQAPKPVATPTPAPVATPAAPARPLAVVALPVDLKDPYTAYGLGGIPFMSGLAATYVGSTRLSWRPNDELMGAAQRQALMDWGLLAGGLALTGLAQAMPYEMRGQGTFVGIATLVAIPVSHWLLYAPWWGEQAVELNRRELSRHGFPLDLPAPLILAPTAD